MAPTHAPITGGCLCAAVRYTINFPSTSPFPPCRQSCQCTQCRKTTGTLVLHLFTVSPSQIVWTGTQGFKEFRSSPPCLRGFCSNCGSSLTWRNVDKEEEIDVFLGTLDEIEPELAIPKDAQYFCGNAIRGVTDPVEGGGETWVKMKEDGRGEKWTGYGSAGEDG